MKVLIPAAGTGTRLYPHTHTKPKAMIFVAGKPLIGHILDRLAPLRPEEVIVVVGYMRERLVDYVKRDYGRRFRRLTFVPQEEQLGLGHAVHAAAGAIGESPLMIALGDMIFKAGYREFLAAHRRNRCGGSIGVKRVDDPRHYGIAVLDRRGRIRRLVEKPRRSPSRWGIAGIYILEEPRPLLETLAEMASRPLAPGREYQLTDALQRLVEGGAHLRTFEVSEWYDCGRKESLLDANRNLLRELRAKNHHPYPTAVFLPPVAIGRGAVIRHSVIGPNVSVGDGATIEHSVVEDSIIGAGSTLQHLELHGSVVGDHARVSGRFQSLNIGDSSTLEL
ncbi:MAG: NTP transferase domain-containing protein [Euryarchaeota archaeon]|nr:NTP transferase domain-containing protein [Euryarchaeota archaeon]